MLTRENLVIYLDLFSRKDKKLGDEKIQTVKLEKEFRNAKRNNKSKAKEWRKGEISY